MSKRKKWFKPIWNVNMLLFPFLFYSAQFINLNQYLKKSHKMSKKMLADEILTSNIVFCYSLFYCTKLLQLKAIIYNLNVFYSIKKIWNSFLCVRVMFRENTKTFLVLRNPSVHHWCSQVSSFVRASDW